MLILCDGKRFAGSCVKCVDRLETVDNILKESNGRNQGPYIHKGLAVLCRATHYSQIQQLEHSRPMVTSPTHFTSLTSDYNQSINQSINLILYKNHLHDHHRSVNKSNY
jgi:hypothetical protein